MSATRWLVAGTIALGGVAAPSLASAGTITGKVLLPKEKQEPPVRSQGFVMRKANPIMPTRPYDLRPHMVVVLSGEIPDEAKTPPTQPAVYPLVGESFASPVFAVQVGRTVRLLNKGRNSPHLRSKQIKDVGQKCSPLNPDVNCDVKLTTKWQVVDVTAQGNPHLHGRIVAVPHGLFSTIDKNGNYKIANVPAGTWKVRIRYGGKFLGETEVTVPKRRGRRDRPVKAPTYQLPNDIKPKSGK